MNALPTRHAPAERLSVEDVRRQHDVLETAEHVRVVINALSTITAILNAERQIVFANEQLLRQLGVSIDQVLGCRPGELVHCVQADREAGGCGTSEACRYCGAVNTIMQSQRLACRIVGDCRILAQGPDRIVPLELQVTATPFRYKENTYTIIELRDVSDIKRRQALEDIFFHDVVNTVGAVEGLLKMIESEQCGSRDFEEILPLLTSSTHQLTQEILAQRQLTLAEKGELQTRNEDLDALAVLSEVVAEYSAHKAAYNRHVIIDPSSVNGKAHADPTLLHRVLANMIKNAIEATPEGGTVITECRPEKGRVILSVNNPGVMPESVRWQVFQRSFSTKGANRGLGTYSIKLLGETYLKGKVSFTSDAENGTTFFLDLPAAPAA